MIPGLPITISCPHCGYLAMQMTFMSRNTIGAKHWSDGKTIAKMYPELPSWFVVKNVRISTGQVKRFGMTDFPPTRLLRENKLLLNTSDSRHFISISKH